MARKAYTSVSMPDGLLEQVERTVTENPRLGYVTATEFIKDAIRRRLEEMEREKRLHPKE